jgi:hypothetical protein
MDPAVEWVTTAYISPRAADIASLVLVTNRGRTLGGAAHFVVTQANAVINAHPCPAGSYKLAYIKGRANVPADGADAENLQELVLVWAPVKVAATSSSSSGSAASARRLTGQSPSPFEPHIKSRPVDGFMAEVHHPVGKLHHTVGNASSDLMTEDEEITPVLVGSYRRAARPGIVVAGVPQAAPCGDRPAGVTATGPFITTGNPAGAVTGYGNGWHTLQRLSGQQMDAVPDITSISIASDRPNQVTSISISYVGGYTVRHGRQDFGLSTSTLQLAVGERIVHVQVGQVFQLAGWPRQCVQGSRDA